MTIFFCIQNYFHGNKFCVWETLKPLTNADRSGGRTDRCTNVQKLEKNKFELFDVVFDKETAMLVLEKIRKNLNHSNELFQELCHHWPNRVLGLSTKTLFD